MPKPAGAKAASANPTAAKRDEFEDFERDQWKRPRIPAQGTSGRANLPKSGYTRSSTLGSTLEDGFNLGQWRMRQVLLGVSRRRDLLLAAQAVRSNDGEGRGKLAEIADAALDAAESNAGATIGTAIHSLTELEDVGGDTSHVTGEAREALDAWSAITAGFGKIAMESKVVCHEHKVAGTFDRLFTTLGPMTTPDGERLPVGTVILADLKTSGTAAYFGLKFAVQLAEYAHGEPFDLQAYACMPWEWLTKGNGGAPHQKWALIVHVPTGNPQDAGLYWVDIESGRDLSALAIMVREQRSRRDLVVAASPPTIPTALSAAGLKAAILSTNDKASLDALWRSHKSVWNAAHTEEAKRQLARFDALTSVGGA